MNQYLHEQLAAMHRQDLHHEVEQYRLASHPSSNQWYSMRHLISKMGTLMIALGTRLQRLDQRYEHVKYIDQYI